MLRCSRRFLSFLAVLLAVHGRVHAAELGDVRVSSHLGQPLVADIELALVDDPAAAVGVRLASPEVYNGAGIAMPPALASLNLSVMRRDGRQFLHITSLRAIDSEHLHLYLELADKGQRTVRLATLWLTPDPNPAPAPVPVSAPAAARAPAVPALTAPAPQHAPVAAAAPAPVRKPAAVPVIPRPALPRPVLQPLPIHGPQPAAPAACVRQAEQVQACAALDVKSAALKERIGTLEGKVKLLQGALRAAPAAPAATPPAAPAAPAAAPAAIVPAGPKPIHAIKPLVPRKPKAPPAAPQHEAGLPWAWIGGGVALLLALGAAAAVVLRRRSQAVRGAGIPKQPRLAERLRDSFPDRAKPASEAAEPGFE
jgi:hypothetical protein